MPNANTIPAANETRKTTKHSHPMVFGRRVAGCPRCAELDAGAPVVRWSGMESKRRFEAQSAAYAHSHNCAASGCGAICTLGD